MRKRFLLALCTVFACSLFVGCAASSGEASKASEPSTASLARVDMGYLKERLASITLLDVRDSADYAGNLDDAEDRNGHVPGAINIPLENMLDKEGSPISDTRLTRMFKHAQLEPTDEIVVYDAGNGDADMAAQLLATCGYTQVYVLSEGFDAWKSDTSNEIEKSTHICCGA